MSWIIDGTPWSGAIKTIGPSGRNYTTLKDAFEANRDVADTLYLIDPGTYNESGAIIGSTKKTFVRGMGTNAANTILNIVTNVNQSAYYPGNAGLINIVENIKIVQVQANGAQAISAPTDSGGGSLTINKCILGSTAIYSRTIGVGTTSGTTKYYIKNSTLYKGESGITASHIYQQNLENIYIQKSDYNATWTTYVCINSLAEDDKAVIGTSGYGYNTGSFLIYEEDLGLRYWIGNGGNWNDTTHWALNSGGYGGASVPVYTDTVVFDSNSFTTTSQTLSMNPTNFLQTLDFTNVTNNPTLDFRIKALDLHGSLILKNGMTVLGSGQSLGLWISNCDCIIDCDGVDLSDVLFTIDDFYGPVSVNITSNLTTNFFEINEGCTISFNCDTLTLNGEYPYFAFYRANSTIDIGECDIIFDLSECNSAYFDSEYPVVYNNVTFQNSTDPVMWIDFLIGGGTEENPIVMDTLSFLGTTYDSVCIGYEGVLLVNDFVYNGSPSRHINLTGTYSNALIIKKTSGEVNVENLEISDIVVGGGAEWNAYTFKGNVDLGGNSGWTWDIYNRYWVPKCRIICLNFEGDNDATEWLEEAQGLAVSYNLGFKISTAQSKFGSSSLTATSGQFGIMYYSYNPNTRTRGDLTFHGWVYFTGLSSSTVNFASTIATPCSTAFELSIDKSTGLPIRLRRMIIDPNSSDMITDYVENPFVDGQWYHIAIISHNRDIMYSIDGVIQETWSYNYNNPLEGTEFRLRAPYDPVVHVWWDAWEMVNYAKWTENFTPPTSAPPLDNPLGSGWVSGNWDDQTHWSYESGGDTSGRVIPDKTYNVIFDENSFPSTGKEVTIVGGAICKSMTWENVINNPTLRFILYEDVIEVYGDITFSESMTINCMPKTILADVFAEIFRFGIKIHRTCHLTSAGHTLPPLLIEYIT